MMEYKSASISHDELYRYVLYRSEDGIPVNTTLFVMLNPSTADANVNDRTIKKCIKFARAWGRDAICVANLYAYRSTDPKQLLHILDPVGPDNNYWLRCLARRHTHVVCAWGNHAKQERVDDFLKLIKGLGVDLWCLGINKSGSPKHPLYIKNSQHLIEWARND